MLNSSIHYRELVLKFRKHANMHILTSNARYFSPPFSHLLTLNVLLITFCSVALLQSHEVVYFQ